MVELQSLTKRFRDYVEGCLRYEYPQRQGWELTPKGVATWQGVKLESVDFRPDNGDSGDQLIVEAKCVQRLTPQHAQGMESYMEVTAARKGFIFVTSDTKTWEPTPRQATASNIEIRRTDFKASSRDGRYPWKL